MGIDPSGNFTLSEMLVTISISKLLKVSGYGAVFGAFFGALGEYATTGEVTWEGIVTGAIAGAVLAPVAVAIPAVGIGFGLGGAIMSVPTFGPMLFDENLSLGRRLTAGTLIVAGFFGARASVKYYKNARGSRASGKSTVVDDLANTPLEKQVSGVSDDAIVNFGSVPRNTVKPGTGGNVFSYRYGDIKHLTPKQIEGIIGPLASAGRTGGSRVMRIIEGRGELVTEEGAVVSDFLEYIRFQAQNVKSNINVQ